MLSIPWLEKQKESERLIIIISILFQGRVHAMPGSGFRIPQWLSQACILNGAEKAHIAGLGTPCAIGIH